MCLIECVYCRTETQLKTPPMLLVVRRRQKQQGCIHSVGNTIRRNEKNKGRKGDDTTPTYVKRKEMTFSPRKPNLTQNPTHTGSPPTVTPQPPTTPKIHGRHYELRLREELIHERNLLIILSAYDLNGGGGVVIGHNTPLARFSFFRWTQLTSNKQKTPSTTNTNNMRGSHDDLANIIPGKMSTSKQSYNLSSINSRRHLRIFPSLFVSHRPYTSRRDLHL